MSELTLLQKIYLTILFILHKLFNGNDEWTYKDWMDM